MCCIAGRSIARPFLRFDIDSPNINVRRSSKLDASSNGKDTKSIGVGMLVVSRLVFKAPRSAERLHVNINTALTHKGKSRPNEISILPNVRRRKNADVVHLAFHTKPSPQIGITIHSETLDVGSSVIWDSEGKARTELNLPETRSHRSGLGMGRNRCDHDENKESNELISLQGLCPQKEIEEEMHSTT